MFGRSGSDLLRARKDINSLITYLMNISLANSAQLELMYWLPK
jgi:hypothetical protein